MNDGEESQAQPQPQPPKEDAYVRTTEEILAEMLASDPVIRGLDEEMISRRSNRKDIVGKKDDIRTKLQNEKKETLRKLTHAAKALADVMFRIQGATLMIARRANTKDLQYAKTKRIRLLRSKARELHKEEAKRASSEFYRKLVSGKKISPPEK